MTIKYLQCRADLNFEVDFGVNGVIVDVMITPSDRYDTIEGGDVLLTCRSTRCFDQPPTSLVWWFPNGTSVEDNLQLPTSIRVRRPPLREFYVMPLIITDAKLTDEGIYRCQANCEHGHTVRHSTDASVILNVYKKTTTINQAKDQCASVTSRRCASHGCYADDAHCDGHYDCSDGTDERNCQTWHIVTPQYADHEDNIEHHPWYFNAIYSAVAGMVGLACVAAIVAVAACRIHMRRAMLQARLEMYNDWHPPVREQNQHDNHNDWYPPAREQNQHGNHTSAWRFHTYTNSSPQYQQHQQLHTTASQVVRPEPPLYSYCDPDAPPPYQSTIDLATIPDTKVRLYCVVPSAEPTLTHASPTSVLSTPPSYEDSYNDLHTRLNSDHEASVRETRL